jgi:aminoglycoside phosphotransferase (APT) family kinase protein
LSVSERLKKALEAFLGSSVHIDDLQRLTGGASRESWSFVAANREMVLRRDPPRRPSSRGSMQREASAMRACTQAGLLVPEILLVDDGALLGTTGMVMARIVGESLPSRILRDDTYAKARRVLVDQLGEFLAGLHAIDPSEIPDLPEIDSVAVHWNIYHHLDDRSVTFEKAHAWLTAHRPRPNLLTVVHGDLRIGNVIVDTNGLAAVIDWELVHLGDPLEDLAWMCVRAWRFGGPLDVGGIGTIDQLVDSYERNGGTQVDRDALEWWIVAKTLQWGVVCMAQGAAHTSGTVRSIELAAIGRRVAEQEWDLIELLARDEWAAARAAPDGPQLSDVAGPNGRPTARELLDAVRGFLLSDVVPDTTKRVSYHAKIAAHVIAIVERELSQISNETTLEDDWASLAVAIRNKLSIANPKRL